jgi:FG-GAP repeat
MLSNIKMLISNMTSCFNLFFCTGAILHDLDGISGIGRVRVFRHDEENEKNQWARLGQDLYGDTANDEFGASVSFSPDGSLLAIFACGSNETDTCPGYVRVFHLNLNQDEWEQLGQDLTGEGGDDDFFGHSLALLNNGIVVGAPDHNGPGDHYGAVRVYHFDENIGDWYQVGQTILGEGNGDEAGVGVDISKDGNTIAVGAWLNDGNGVDAGHVRVFRLSEELNEWLKIGSDIEGEDTDDAFGWSVSLSADGTIVASGAPLNDFSDSISRSGHVRVFKLDPAMSDWVQMGNDINGLVKGDSFGNQVRLSDNGKTLAGSSIFSDGANAGHVRVFDFDETTQDWIQRGSAIDGEAKGDEFGRAISLSADGQVVAVGAVYAMNEEGVETGKIQVFRPIDEDKEEGEEERQV